MCSSPECLEGHGHEKDYGQACIDRYRYLHREGVFAHLYHEPSGVGSVHIMCFAIGKEL